MASEEMVARNCLVESACRKVMTALLTSGWSCRKPTSPISTLLGSPGMLGSTDAAVAAAASCSNVKANWIMRRSWEIHWHPTTLLSEFHRAARVACQLPGQLKVL